MRRSTSAHVKRGERDPYKLTGLVGRILDNVSQRSSSNFNEVDKPSMSLRFNCLKDPLEARSPKWQRNPTTLPNCGGRVARLSVCQLWTFRSAQPHRHICSDGGSALGIGGNRPHPRVGQPIRRVHYRLA